jgi:peptidyl-prolyl cis-trans isomerase D
MATLEKIRRRSVLLIIVIAVALLAFIVGDALTNSRNIFGDRSVVAKIGDTKIDFTDYQRKREELNNQVEMRRRQDPSFQFDNQVLTELALDQLVSETLLDQAVKNLGIRVGGDQLRFYMLDNPVNQNMSVLVQQMAQSGINVQSPKQAYEVIFNPQRNGYTEAQVAPFRSSWLAMEDETKQLIARQTYARLLQSSVKANILDEKALHNDYVTIAEMKYAFLPYGKVDEKKYPVSDSELKEAYNKNKNQYKVKEETKTVSMIVVNVNPSQADVDESKQLAASTVASLQKGSLSKDQKKAGVGIDHKKLRASDLPTGTVREYVLRAPKDSVSLLRNDANGFLAVKMGSRSQEIDSIQLNLVQVAGGTLPKRVLAKLNGGLSIDSLESVFGKDSIGVTKDQWIQLFTAQGSTNALQPSQLDSLYNAGGRYISIVDMPEGSVLAQLVKKNAPVEIYEYDEITYNLKPSSKTVNDARTKLEQFLASNDNAASFNKNAQKAGYTLSQYDFTQSTPAVPVMEGMQQYLPDSRKVVRWVMMDGDKGDVSRIYESNDPMDPMLYVAAVTDVFDDYYPINHRNVKEALTAQVRNEKAGDAMVKQFSGKGNIEQTAAAMGVSVQDGKERMSALGANVRDGRAMGTIMGSKNGTVKVVRGNDGIYAFVVERKTADTIPFEESVYQQQYLQLLSPNMVDMIRGNKKFKNQIYKFEAAD